MPFARASELDRLLSCAGSAILPRMDTRSLGMKQAAEWGTMVHRWAETGQVLDKRLGEKITLAGVDRAALWPNGLHEITLALNVVTGQASRCPDGADKDEWKAAWGDEWVTGSLDFVGELLDCPWVDDLKTGRFAQWADYAAQQSFYALAWSRAMYGESRESRSTITHWPRYPKHLPPTRHGVHLSLDYFANYAKRLAQLRDDVLRLRETFDEGALNPGPQCTYCPSRAHCGKAHNG